MDLDYLIQILVRLKDEASPGLAKLRAEIDALKGSQDADKATQSLGRSTEDLGKKAKKSADQQRGLREEHEKTRRSADDAGRALKDTTKVVDDHGKSHQESSEKVDSSTKAQRDFAESLKKAREELDDTNDGLKEIGERADKTNIAWKGFERTLNSGSLSKGEAALKLRQYSSEMKGLARNVEFSSDAFKDLVKNADNADKYLKRYKSGSYGGSNNFLDAIKEGNAGAVLDKIGSKFDDLGLRITGVSSFLRGFFELAKIGFSQQLITGIASLAGSFVSLASAAAQAGAALAGAFVSGLGQLIPMVSIAAAAAERFKSILQAVSITGKAEEQKYFDPNEKQVTQLQNTSQLISSQQQLSNSYIQLYEAQQRVRDSQIALTEARYTASRQLKELTLDEKDARLQAEGANLSLAEARRQLQIDIRSGDTAGLAQAELAVKEAEVSKEKAQYAVPKAEREARLARQRGIAGEPAVISATEGVASSRQGVIQAKQAGEAAKRQEQITRLQQAARSSHETSSESQLSFLKKGMSKTELGLYNALVEIEKELKSPDSPIKKITDYLVEPFTNAVERIRSLLKNNSFLGPIDELAAAMGKGLSRLEKATFGKQGTSFFETMAKDASKNIPVVVSSIESLMKLFEDVAKAADPAFHKLSEDWDNFWHDIDQKYEEPGGLKKLTDFFNKSVVYAEKFAHLGTTLAGLFVAIGHDAAPQGLATVSTFTETIEKATQWIQSHGPEVTNFFKEAREGLSVLGELLFGVGKQLIEVFSLSSLKAFSLFLQQIVIPAAKNVVEVLGFLTKVLLEIANAIPGGKDVLEGLAGAFLGLEVLGKATGPITKTVKAIQALSTAFSVLKDTGSVRLAWEAMISVFKGVEKSAGGAAANTRALRDAEATSVTPAQADAAAQGEVAAAEGAEGAGGVAGLAGGAAGIASKAFLPAAAIAALVATREAGQQTGPSGLLTGNESEFGGKLSRYSGKELGDLEHFNIGGFVGGLFGSGNDETKSEEKLRKFGNEVEKLKGRLGDLPKAKLEEIQHEAESLGNNPALNKFKGVLENTSKTFNPSELAAKKWANNIKEYMEGLNPVVRGVAESFKSISGSTQFIFKQVRENVKTNIESIKEDLGLNSKLGKEALAKNFGEAETAIYQSIGKGTVTTKKGMAEIRKLVSEALKKYGVSDSEIESGRNPPTSAKSANESTNLHKAGFAAGEYVPARSGGISANIAEGGHDEVVLSTDPAHASRSKSLLGRYFRAAPHMADGGFVADPGTNFTINQEPKIVTELRKLGEYLHTTIYGISGYRSPSHSVEVGGFSDDPHTRGEAADIGVGANTLESAAKLNPGLLSKFDLYRPFYPASAHEINHVQLIPGDVAGIAGSLAGLGSGVSSGTSAITIPSINAPKIKGGGTIGAVSQAALNIATKAANIYLSKQSGSGSLSGLVGKLGGGDVEKQIMRFFISSGLSKIAASGIAGNAGQESSFDPNAAGGGLFQDIGGRGAPQGSPVLAQLKAALGELRGSYRSVLARLMGAKSPQEAARIFSEGFERPGIPDIGNREHYASEAYASYAQGGIAPWGGRPVPIIAHEGERIMNPAQYGETARLAGTSPSGLDSHLGYNSTPRQSFADGGIPTITGIHAQRSSGSPMPFSLSSITGEFSNFNPIFNDPRSSESIKSIAKIFKLITEGFKKLKAIGKDNEKYANEMGAFVNTIIEESNGILAKLKQGREVVKSKLSGKKTEAGFSGVIGSSKPGEKIGLSGRGLSTLEKQKTIKLGVGGQAAMDTAEVKALAQEGKELSKESNLISTAMSKVKSGLASAHKIKNGSKRATAIKLLTADYDKLITEQKELTESMSSNIEARYQAEAQKIQDEVTQLNTAYQTISQELSSAATTASSMGNLGAIGGIEVQIRQAAENQIQGLSSRLKSAEATGDTELVASIKQEMISLHETINNSVIEQLNAAQTLIQRENQQVSTGLGVQQTRAQTFGNLAELPGIDEAIANNAKKGISELQGLLVESENDHDTAKSIEIKEAIASLEDTVISATAAKINDSISLIQREAGLRESGISEKLGLSKVKSQEGKYGEAGELEKRGLEEKSSSLKVTRFEEEVLKQKAEKEGDTAAVITLTEELNKNTSEIAENNLALKENMVVTRELVVNQIEATGQFKTGIYKSAISGLETIGKITGFTNVKGLLESAKGEGTALNTERVGIAGQAKGLGLNVEGMTPAQILTYLASPEGQANLSKLESSEDKGEKEQMYKLVGALENNATATLQNTEKIAELNGSLNSPQSFTTTAFSSFRNAIFSGMGELNPAYQTAATLAGTAEMPKYAMATPGQQSGGNTYNLNIPHPVEVLDPQLLGEQFNHAVTNAPVM